LLWGDDERDQSGDERSEADGANENRTMHGVSRAGG
jgi:hypothetical protein